MNPTKRLLINTLATYGRSVFSVVLILFSSRWVLNALGQTDFGLFNVVGSIIIFITFLNTVMSGSISRYYAYSIGQRDSDEVIYWFNSALSLHLCMSVVLTLIGWPIGEYVISNILIIPDTRLDSCLWVFRVSLISAFVSMLSIPCVAMFTAQQRIAEIAFWNILKTMLTFSMAFILTKVIGDLLLIYATGMVVIIVFIQLSIVFRAFYVFSECKILLKYWFDWERYKKIASFAIWNLIGSTGATMRDQGSAILLNMFFGPDVNSAYGIARQVSAQSNQLSAAMLGAFSPEITASEGRGDRNRMLGLSMKASKYGTILVLLFAIPLMVEMDYILKIWLKHPPAYTAIFCRLIMTTFLIDRLTSGFMIAVNAHGKIAAYQATIGVSLVLTLPIAWLFLHLGYSPVFVCVAFIITMIISSLGRVFWAKYLFGVSPFDWFKTVVIPCITISFFSLIAGSCFVNILQQSFLRLILVASSSIVVSAIISWFWAFEQDERDYVARSFKKVTNKYISR